MKQFIIILFSLILLASCAVFSRSKALSVDQYAQWYSKEKSVLTTQLEVSSIQYELSYVPYEFQVGYALNQGDLTLDEAKEMQGDFANEHTFKLTLVLPTQGKDIYSFNQKSELDRKSTRLNSSHITI